MKEDTKRSNEEPHAGIGTRRLTLFAEWLPSQEAILIYEQPLLMWLFLASIPADGVAAA